MAMKNEKIGGWLNDEIRKVYQSTGVMPRDESAFEDVLSRLHVRTVIEEVGVSKEELRTLYFTDRNARIDKVERQILREKGNA